MFKKKAPTLEQLRAEAAQRQAQWNKESALQNTAADCEKSGDINGAIHYYNELVKMKFLGSNPYKRLCMIYHKHKMYKQELEVIEKFRAVTGNKYFDTCQEGKYVWFRDRKAKLIELLKKG